MVSFDYIIKKASPQRLANLKMVFAITKSLKGAVKDDALIPEAVKTCLREVSGQMRLKKWIKWGGGS